MAFKNDRCDYQKARGRWVIEDGRWKCRYDCTEPGRVLVLVNIYGNTLAYGVSYRDKLFPFLLCQRHYREYIKNGKTSVDVRKRNARQEDLGEGDDGLSPVITGIRRARKRKV